MNVIQSSEGTSTGSGLRNSEVLPGISWINTVRKYDLDVSDKLGTTTSKKLVLTEQHEALVYNKLKTTLLPHQQRTVQAMKCLENKRVISVVLESSPFSSFLNPVIETCAGIVSEKPGSGKTFEVLALIGENVKIKPIAEITSLPLPKLKPINKTKSNSHTFVNNGFTFEVRKTYKKIFRQTLIFAGKSVLTQWADRIQKYTTFEVFIIENIFKLRDFYQMLFKSGDKKALDKYDIILIKNASIAGKFDIPELIGTPLEKIKSKPILNIFGELFKDCCWERVVLDDFDTLAIPTNAPVIPTKFTWFISATKKNPVTKRSIPVYHTTEDILKSFRPTYVSIWNNRELFTIFNISCENSFIDSSTNASMIKYFVYKFVNLNESFINLIGNMGANTQNIAEMLNGDAIRTAAAAVGVKTNSVGDIFEKILDKNWNIYKKNIEIERYIPRVIAAVNALTNGDDPITQKNLDKLRKNVRKPGPLSSIHKIVHCKQNSVFELIDEIKTSNTASKEENGKSIQRVKDNLKEGDCPITCEPLKECRGIVLLKCCGVAISQEAAEQLFTNNAHNVCPKCRAKIDSSKVILIDREIDINQILEDDIEVDEPTEIEELIEELVEEIVELELDDAEEFAEDSVLNKFNCIIKIIEGNDAALSGVCEVRDDILIPNLLEGSNDCGFATPDEKKVIIFTNFKEAMDNIEKRLMRKKIPYAWLHGSIHNINDIIRRYWLPNQHPESINVLLISGAAYCAGLDLQNTTDLIFAHKVIDINIETQIAGRGARFGRTRNFKIHYVLYENEYTELFADRKNRQDLDMDD